jgi:hypothetical protein
MQGRGGPNRPAPPPTASVKALLRRSPPRPWLAALLLLPLLGGWYQYRTHYAALPHTGTAHAPPRRQQHGADAEAHADNSWASAQAIAAAAAYMQGVVQWPKARPRVPAKQYLLDPESHDMRQQHRKVRVWCVSECVSASVCLLGSGSSSAPVCGRDGT